MTAATATARADRWIIFNIYYWLVVFGALVAGDDDFGIAVIIRITANIN